ncbi:hypothetical protein [Alloalcanivorax gelatiniphagus]|uniref:Uncharacterized protein n=1 Tax=Alloalcanivorax gelatiniphagus TaxID=1194167 RepID=A0ABY2XHB7_9GAMM|nr:hypothetical protein [Alloalcanivorax gelatiniphagus]TMW11053.1 hypothetical protein FGS76_17285 [Alloalcanivorax gelatiniphagus]
MASLFCLAVMYGAAKRRLSVEIGPLCSENSYKSESNRGPTPVVPVVLGVTRQKNGDLVFEGQDLGQGVRDAFGCAEYQWRWTIKAPDVKTLEAALGGKHDALELLRRHFSDANASGLYGFLQEHGIPFESWSRIGD